MLDAVKVPTWCDACRYMYFYWHWRGRGPGPRILFNLLDQNRDRQGRGAEIFRLTKRKMQIERSRAAPPPPAYLKVRSAIALCPNVNYPVEGEAHMSLHSRCVLCSSYAFGDRCDLSAIKLL